ncbi:regulatory protein RecX [Microbacterium sp. BG28]|uniref:regulatory protein RecX n=1 Tax=Microbacterium sp. BG28 TaxID=3097356 RepID=UPI002A5AB970|nr:regulatory protein RecX [Microbacterium sp. BG28]MDY0830593.1 regulatory protein RecX [Microbacterium sp. BG28]
MTHEDDRGEVDALAPVIPLFGPRSAAPASSPAESVQRGTGPFFVPGPEHARDTSPFDASHDVDTDSDTDSEPESDDAALAQAASDALLRKLRARSLSEREARTFLAQRDLSRDAVEEIVAGFLRLSYLDDAALAEQLVHVGVSRKGEGRIAIAQAMARRGVPRDVADAALEAVGDDDAERALEFARRKATSIGGRDDDAALRRLVGQLARRGYPSSVAMTAARQALAEARRPAVRGPRFD